MGFFDADHWFAPDVSFIFDNPGFRTLRFTDFALLED
jgi:hypothetical protein